MTEPTENIRLDKWLWAARFYKTRALAKTAIESSRIHYDGSRAKPSRSVELGVSVKIQIGWEIKTIIIKQISDKRHGAPVAQQMYEETAESVVERLAAAEQRKTMNMTLQAPDHRPNKRDRRHIHRFKTQSHE